MKLKARLLGWMAAMVAKTIRRTMRIQRIKHPSFDPKEPCIYAFWHGDLLVPILSVRVMFSHKVAGFVSTSKDGDILSSMLSHLGYEVARGSTSKRAIGGLVHLLRMAREGYSLGLTPDGPRGPRHEVSQGLMFLAQKSKMPVVAVGVHVSRFKRFEKAWDKFCLPKLFSKAVVYFDKPVFFEASEKQGDCLLKQKLMDASVIAEQIACGDKLDIPLELIQI